MVLIHNAHGQDGAAAAEKEVVEVEESELGLPVGIKLEEVYDPEDQARYLRENRPSSTQTADAALFCGSSSS